MKSAPESKIHCIVPPEGKESVRNGERTQFEEFTRRSGSQCVSLVYGKPTYSEKSETCLMTEMHRDGALVLGYLSGFWDVDGYFEIDTPIQG
jgi:hypothetical protein